jgi:hypothetical protein
MIPLLILYIIPAILSIIVLYTTSSEVTVAKLLAIIVLSSIPLLNFFIGYIGGLVALSESESVNKFFNTRIK